LHKLRRAMVAPEREPLSSQVEIDEAFIGGRHTERRGGRQRDGKSLVGVAVERRGRGAGRLRLQVLPDASHVTLGPWVSAIVKPGAIVHTDGWDGYGRLSALGFDHRPRRRRETPPEQMLPLAHRAVSNLKTWLQGTHRGVAPEHLQVYLEEFVIRHNRRRTPMAGFQTLLGLSATHASTTYAQITAHHAQPEPTG
jgi:transposase-like protein